MSEQTRDAVQRAMERGLEVVAAHPQTLQVDDDTPLPFSPVLTEAQKKAREIAFRHFVDMDNALMTISQNGNKHYYYKLKQEMPPVYRIALQLILGSDPAREILNLVSEWNGLYAAEGQLSMALFETEDGLKAVKEFYDSAQIPQGD